MITGGKPWELNGLSTDDKYNMPDVDINKVPNGSTLLEMDTRKVYKFDAETKQWLQL